MTAGVQTMLQREPHLLRKRAGFLARWLSLLLLAGLPATALAQPALQVPIDAGRFDAAEEDSGFIEALVLDGPYIRVNGTTYGFETGAYVEVRGIRAAPTLLAPGMNVQLRFLMPNGKRQIIYLRQIADAAPTMAR